MCTRTGASPTRARSSRPNRRGGWSSAGSTRTNPNSKPKANRAARWNWNQSERRSSSRLPTPSSATPRSSSRRCPAAGRRSSPTSSPCWRPAPRCCPPPTLLRAPMPDRSNAVYIHGHHESVLRSHRWRTVENSAAYLMPHLRAGVRLLDVGCGPGTITADFARRVAPGVVIGIDASADVIAEAQRDHPGVTFAPGDVYRLDYQDASFDVVHAHQVLQHLADPVAALLEMRRVVRPGGIVAVRDADYGAFRWHPADDRLTRWLALYRTIARANSGEP